RMVSTADAIHAATYRRRDAGGHTDPFWHEPVCGHANAVVDGRPDVRHLCARSSLGSPVHCPARAGRRDRLRRSAWTTAAGCPDLDTCPTAIYEAGVFRLRLD